MSSRKPTTVVVRTTLHRAAMGSRSKNAGRIIFALVFAVSIERAGHAQDTLVLAKQINFVENPNLPEKICKTNQLERGQNYLGCAWLVRNSEHCSIYRLC
jgi:hypothetical protein